MRNVSIKLVSSLFVVAAVASPAAAQDKKNYPGVTCLASGAAITNIERPSSGRATNLAATDTTFVCPAVKDAANIAGATMFVIDQRSDRGVSCTLRVGRPDSTAVQFASNGTTTTFLSSEPKQLDFPAIAATSFGFYLFSCTVPSPANGLRSGVVMYQINENE